MGAFIVLEGIDGTGKTTACRSAAEILRSEGRDAEVTFEPTDTGVGALIRSGAAGRISQRAESLLFVADRIEPTLARASAGSMSSRMTASGMPTNRSERVSSQPSSAESPSKEADW